MHVNVFPNFVFSQFQSFLLLSGIVLILYNFTSHNFVFQLIRARTLKCVEHWYVVCGASTHLSNKRERTIGSFISSN